MMSKLSAGMKTQKQQSELAFQYVITELLKYELDSPIALSLLEYKGISMDIELVLDMSNDDIDDLHYFTKEVDTSSTPTNDKKEEANSKVIIVKRDLPRGLKRLVKVFVCFHKHLRAEGVDIYFDWTNIELKTFHNYRQYVYDGNDKTPAPIRLVKKTNNE